MGESLHTKLFSTLEEFSMERLRVGKKNRLPLEAKWRQNLEDYHPYVKSFEKWDRARDPASAEIPAEVDDEAEAIKIGVGKNKTMTAKSVICDTQFKGGRVQFRLAPDDEDEFEAETQAADMAGAPMQGDPGMDTGMMDGPPPEAQTRARHRKDVTNVDEILIHRQLEMCDAVEELSSCVLNAGLYGITFAKRYVREYRHRSAGEVAPGVISVVDQQETHPAVEKKSPWRMLWDIESGLSVREGAFVAEMDDISLADLAVLAGDPSYDAEAIKELIKGQIDAASGEAGGQSADDPRKEKIQAFERDVRIYELWQEAPDRLIAHYERTIASRRPSGADTAEPSSAPEPGASDEDDPIRQHAMSDVLVTIIEVGGEKKGRIIRFARVNKWDRPYYSSIWEELPDDIASIGVMDNLHQLQTVITRTVNALIKNAEATAQTMGFWKPEMLAGKNLKRLKTGEWQTLSEDCKDARMAVQQMTLSDTTGSLREVTEMLLGFVDLFSHIPKAEQGQQEKTAQTAFELGQRLERAGKYLGDVIRNIDRMIEDIVRDFYFFNLLDVNHVTTRRYRVKALGFSTFEDKQSKMTKLVQALSMALEHPALEALTRVRYLWEEFLKLLDLDTLEALKSPQELREEAAERQAALSASPPADPAEHAKQAATILAMQAAAREKEASAMLKQAKAQEASSKTIREDAKAAADMDREAAQFAHLPPAVQPAPPEPALL